MQENTQNTNKLINEKSPYLLQHANNPVNWEPWGSEAFVRAKKEDKPVFLSVGYSSCHWCHVMNEESFADNETAAILNDGFVCVKVDKEERPDVDSVYMNVCMETTGSGGWPMSVFMTPEQKPFFSGTYFPKHSQYGLLSFKELLTAIDEKWHNERPRLLSAADEITFAINAGEHKTPDMIDINLPVRAYETFAKTYDRNYGGFGDAPKFPCPHNLLFLLRYYEKHNEKTALHMAEHTLIQMYKGGIFDHVGYGFSRYSTDKYFLQPHFEKMLYDNALLIICYAEAYRITHNALYKEIAQKTALYIEREMTAENGAFFSSQDADSDGVEGKYYLFDYDEIGNILGDEANDFRKHYGVTETGNFEGGNILNLLNLTMPQNAYADTANAKLLPSNFDGCINKLYEYRKTRFELRLDDKITTANNALMIAAFALLSDVAGEPKYLEKAMTASEYIEQNLRKNNTLYVGIRDGKLGVEGFIDDYAFYAYSQIILYDVSTNEKECEKYLNNAVQATQKAVTDFFDVENGGFYLYGVKSERLISRPKDGYDGALPSGNSVMAYVLSRLSVLRPDLDFAAIADKHFKYMSFKARSYPSGYSFFMSTLLGT